MANTVLNPSIIAKTSVRILENELVMARNVYRGFEEEFDRKINGYDVGDTISIRKPQQFTVRSGATAAIQDVSEGKLSLVVGTQQGVDFSFSSLELTLKIEQLADRVIRPAMVRLANAVDTALMALYTQIPNWVGQPATGVDATIDSFADFARGAERLDQTAAPQDMRYAVLAPDSYWALAGSQTALFAPTITTQAYRRGEIGDIGGVSTYMSQNVPTHVNANGDAAATVAAAGGAGVLSTTYAAVMNTEATPGTMSINVTAAGTGTIKAGTVFTLGTGVSAVKAVNPVTKAVLPYQQMFTVTADATITATNATLVITPPIIALSTAAAADQAWVTVDIPPAAGTTLQIVGDATGSYRQNLMFHRDAFALVMVPMVKPPGAVDVARESYKGTNVRVIPYYNGSTDVSSYRLDILYGVKVIDNRLAVRMGGGSGTLGNPAA